MSDALEIGSTPPAGTVRISTNVPCAESELASSPCSVPKRRFGITLTAGGNTLEDISELLEHIAREMTANPGIMSSTIGGCDYGGHYDIEDRGEHITKASYRQSLEDWIQGERRARNAERSNPAAESQQAHDTP
jgi:hypothetical protein